MKYSYEIKITQHGKFKSMSFLLPKEIRLVGTFLFSDVQSQGSWFIKQIDQVLSGKLKQNECHGNVCGLEINRDRTKVVNNLADDGEGDWCVIETNELKDLIKIWEVENERFDAENK